MQNKIIVVTVVCFIMISTTVFASNASGELAKLLPTDIKTLIIDVPKGKSSLTKNISGDFKAAQSLYLYQYHPNTNSLELLSDEVVVNVNGEVTLPVKGDIVVLADSPITENLAKPSTSAPIKNTSAVSKTGDGNSEGILALAGAMIISSAGTLIVTKQNFL